MSVRDNAQTLKKEDIENCFNPFFSKKDISRGKGLGLSFAKSLSKKLDGDIIAEVTSSRTIFKFSFS